MIGKTLGPYQVVAKLGEGGMGEVYKARDTRLERTVAIKVLSQDLAGDEGFRARFDREAKAISQLSHPHICALHDVGQQDGVHFLVLEHLQGETLATRIARGAIPVDQAIAIAVEICGALDNAHRHGVTHRDVKPGNVMLTKTGSKLLDFGLAKSSPAGADGMTRAAPITAQGSILGTFQYMAPEQLEGQEADPRSDIWALGCTLYEMVTGRPAFAGKTQASLIGAILTDEPARMSTVQAFAPAGLDRVVMACLAKDPDGRWQSAADIARELAWVATAASDRAPTASRGMGPSSARSAASRRCRKRRWRSTCTAPNGRFARNPVCFRVRASHNSAGCREAARVSRSTPSARYLRLRCLISHAAHQRCSPTNGTTSVPSGYSTTRASCSPRIEAAARTICGGNGPTAAARPSD
jgi:serine/threonine protein kinase